MSLRVTIALAGPARGKGRPRAAVGKDGHAHVYPDARTTKYESQLRYAAQQQMAGRAPTILPVRVHVEVFVEIAASSAKWEHAAAATGHLFPIKRNSGDADNFLKILDALNKIVWDDDAQIVEAHVFKRYGQPRLVISIETLDPPPRPEHRAARPEAVGDLLAGAAA